MKIKLSKSKWESIGKTSGLTKKAQKSKPFTFDHKDPKNYMPGQAPYTDEEYAKSKQLIGDAAKGDPGEIFDKGTTDYYKFIEGLGGKVSTYKENENYKIFVYNENHNLSNSDIKYLASSKIPIYLSVLEGKLALFVFKNQ